MTNPTCATCSDIRQVCSERGVWDRCPTCNQPRVQKAVAPSRVTAETITDEQLRELRRTCGLPLSMIRACDAALSPTVSKRSYVPPKTKHRARERCATAWNERHGGAQ